jgi:YaiO family outer membrane protein
MKRPYALRWCKPCATGLVFFCLLLGILFFACPRLAAAENNSAELRNRIELSGTYEYLSPHTTYGDWETLSAALYRKDRTDFTWFTQAQAFSRKEGNGLLAAAGAYKDWTDSFYTYTAVAGGTNSAYLPRIRFDHDFNLKLGPEKKFVWVVGGTYIRNFGDHTDYILSTGLIAYQDKWVAEYRLFRNLSSPGWVESYSHLFSLAYGQDGWQWTTATCSFGKQAYLATQLATPEVVNNNSLLVTLNHRQWLAKNHGVFGELSYFDLQSAYKKAGVLIGVFREF